MTFRFKPAIFVIVLASFAAAGYPQNSHTVQQTIRPRKQRAVKHKKPTVEEQLRANAAPDAGAERQVGR